LLDLDPVLDDPRPDAVAAVLVAAIADPRAQPLDARVADHARAAPHLVGRRAERDRGEGVVAGRERLPRRDRAAADEVLIDAELEPRVPRPLVDAAAGDARALDAAPRRVARAEIDGRARQEELELQHRARVAPGRGDHEAPEEQRPLETPPNSDLAHRRRAYRDHARETASLSPTPITSTPVSARATPRSRAA